MDDRIQQALIHDQTIDITTTGRRTGQPRRIEIWFHNIDGHIYLTGRPGKRGWYANLRANPAFTFHLKGSVQADLVARAIPITEATQRRTILKAVLDSLDRHDPAVLDRWVEGSPLVEATFLSA